MENLNINNGKDLEKFALLDEISKQLSFNDAATILRLVMKRLYGKDIFNAYAFMDEDNQLFQIVIAYADKENEIHNKLGNIVDTMNNLGSSDIKEL